MTKKLFASAFFSMIVGASLLPVGAMASEGVADLRGSGTGGACFASSVFIDGVYKIMATCRDMKIALSPEKNKYVLWMVDENEKSRRLGEIVSGKYYGQVDQRFLKLYVTAERDSYTNKPSEDVLLSGQMRDIDFGAGIAPAETITTPTPTQKKEVVIEKNTDIQADENEGGLGSALSAIFKIALLGFGALLLIVGVFSFLSRRRSL